MRQRETRKTISISGAREAWPFALLSACIWQAPRLVHNVSLMLYQTSATAGSRRQIKCSPRRWVPVVCLDFHAEQFWWLLWSNAAFGLSLCLPPWSREFNRSQMAPNNGSQTSTIAIYCIRSHYVKLENTFLQNVQKCAQSAFAMFFFKIPFTPCRDKVERSLSLRRTVRRGSFESSSAVNKISANTTSPLCHTVFAHTRLCRKCV